MGIDIEEQKQADIFSIKFLLPLKMKIGNIRK